MLEAWPSEAENIHDPRSPADPLGAQARARVAIDDQLLGLGVEPHSGLEGFEFVFGQPVFRPFPDPRGLSDMGVTVKSGEVLHHRCKLLHRHAPPPYLS